MYLDYNPIKTYVCDIEADSLTPSVVWCMGWQNAGNKETGLCVGHDAIRAFFEQTKGCIYVFHNGLKYDAPVLGRLLGIRLSVSDVIDTLVLSTLYSPSLSGGHSLAAWGERLGKAKGEFSDFSRYTEEMGRYCLQDISITAELFIKLVKVLTKIGFSEKSIEIQHRFTVILDRQSRNGFYFDGQRALGFLSDLRTRQSELEDIIHGVFQSERLLVAERGMFRKDGTPTAIYLKDVDRYSVEQLDDGLYRAYDDVPFNIGSPKQRVDKLVGLGWQAREFTEAGTPTPFIKGKLAPSLEQFLEDHDVPEVELIARWMSINGRANMVSNWIDNWNEDTGCIHGKLLVADTLRLRHQAPNTANIPAVRTLKDGTVLRGEDGYYTYEARDLWCARPGRVLVGTDAAGLELRMLAHQLHNPKFTSVVLQGDPHQANADLVGISRAQAKTILYASMYGASGKKIAKTLDLSIKEGTEILETFLSKLGISDLIQRCKREQSQGRIELIDGSKIICPSPHAALNYKLQGNGARVMALALILLDRHLKRENLDAMFVGNIHDEIQADVLPEHSDKYSELSVQSIREAGEHLNMNIPLDGTAKKGLTWSQTH